MVRVMWIQLKWVDRKKVRLVRATFRLRPFNSIFMFNQTFQISILWRPTIPIDHMTDIVAAAPALQTDDLNPQTTPDIHLHKSAMAGKEHQPGFQEINKLVVIFVHIYSVFLFFATFSVFDGVKFRTIQIQTWTATLITKMWVEFKTMLLVTLLNSKFKKKSLSVFGAVWALRFRVNLWLM